MSSSIQIHCPEAGRWVHLQRRQSVLHSCAPWKQLLSGGTLDICSCIPPRGRLTLPPPSPKSTKTGPPGVQTSIAVITAHILRTFGKHPPEQGAYGQGGPLRKTEPAPPTKLSQTNQDRLSNSINCWKEPLRLHLDARPAWTFREGLFILDFTICNPGVRFFELIFFLFIP